MIQSLTVELDAELLQSLDRLAARTERSRADLIQAAVEDYVSLQNWQIAKIEAGLAAAERGDFVNDDEIERIAAKYAKGS